MAWGLGFRVQGLPAQPLNPKSVADDEDVGLDLPSSQGQMGSKQTATWGISVKAAWQSLRSVRGFGGFALNDFLDKSLKSFTEPFTIEVAWQCLCSVNDFRDLTRKSFRANPPKPRTERRLCQAALTDIPHLAFLFASHLALFAGQVQTDTLVIGNGFRVQGLGW